MEDTKIISDYDRKLGELHGLPDGLETKPVVIQAVDMSGRGAVYTVQTFRLEDELKRRGDTIFLTCIQGGQTIQLVLPPAVAAAIARQREGLSKRHRSRVAKRVAQDRLLRGELPFRFMRVKKQEAPQ
jgi:hypothetical protein